MNASDIYGDGKRPEYLQKETEKMKAIGLDAEELDLRSYFDDNTGLKSKLKEYGLLWAMGGNSFVLRRAMKVSGFDQIIAKLLTDETLVYGGFSAGAVVATESLHGIELVDDPVSVPEVYDSEVIWDGLGLVNFSFAPHYRSNHPESDAIEEVVKYFEANSMPYKALHDGEVLVMTNEETRLLT